MDILNIIAAFATILSFIVSILVYNKVNKIDKSINMKKSKKEKNNTIKGNDNVVSGRDSNIKR
ncbi:hypothetical protein IRZ71_02465 [Flavobacterium sp. ANB]|uniref:hypothetical protein n=1 Tax=unclassified Flavobacterium TaxID=196869 RepID=UPI0012B9E3EB|nr:MULTISPECIES: hypothetical protein [unclassified Flavobacterium]MBF4515183.1 hypothetical protein [Flavobacterium sp. ANB]MTD70095.1 hypothetical protein [Flavobacterium sp. LC2016-13]